MRKLVMSAIIGSSISIASAEPVTYKIDPTHTYVNWEVRHFGTSTNRGRWDKKEGTITIDREARTGSAKISIDLTSLNTGYDTFNEHLSGKNFFQGNELATFTADQFVFDRDQVSEVTGELTMMGKTNPVTIKATHFNCYDNPFFKKQVCGGDFEGTIQRSQWGLKYGLPNIPDDVRLLIQIEAVREDS